MKEVPNMKYEIGPKNYFLSPPPPKSPSYATLIKKMTKVQDQGGQENMKEVAKQPDIH